MRENTTGREGRRRNTARGGWGTRGYRGGGTSMRFTSSDKLRCPWAILRGLAVLFVLCLAGGDTGVEPRALAQSTDPAVVGQWSALQNWPDVAVHSSLLSDGKVLFWAYS